MINQAYCLAHELDAVNEYNYYSRKASYYYAKATETGVQAFASVARGYDTLAETALIEAKYYRGLFLQCIH